MSIREWLAEVDWKETGALFAVLGVLFIPVRYVGRIIMRRFIVPTFTEILESILKPRLDQIEAAAAKAGECTDRLDATNARMEAIAERFEQVDEDITILFDAALNIDRRSWEERRAEPRPGTVDRRRSRRLPLLLPPLPEDPATS